MRLLIAVKSCLDHRNSGYHEAILETWAKDLSQDIDLRFFCGWNENFFSTKQEKVVFLRVRDDYDSLPEKTKAILTWSKHNHYDYTFLVDNDTFIVPKLLFALPFQGYDYSGHFGHGPAIGTTFEYTDGRNIVYNPCYPWASGGYGQFVSKKMAEIVADEEMTGWAEDMMLGRIAAQHGVRIGNLDIMNKATFHYPKSWQNGPWSYDPSTKWHVYMYNLYKGAI